MNSSPSRVLGALLMNYITRLSIIWWVPAQPWIAVIPKEELNCKWKLGEAALVAPGQSFLWYLLWYPTHKTINRMPHDCDFSTGACYCRCMFLLPLHRGELWCTSWNTLRTVSTGWLHFAVVQIAYDTFCVCLKHVFTETYILLKEDVFCADLTDQVLVYFHVAYLRHRVFKKVIYGMRKNS